MASDQSFSKTVSLGEEALNNLSSEVDWYGFETRVRHVSYLSFSDSRFEIGNPIV